MALSVVEFKNNVVTIESDMDNSRGKEFPKAIGELSSMEARRLAEKHAAQNGIASPGLGMPTSPYPVDQEGQVIESPTGSPHRYRVDVPVTARV